MLLTLSLTSCTFNLRAPITHRDGTFWVSDDPVAYIRIDSGIRWNNIGKLYIDVRNGEFVEIVMDVDGGVDVYDPNKFTFRERDGAVYIFDALLFTGTCKLRNDSFTITVTRSEVDYIAVGDVIVFNRVDELPEWAVSGEVCSTQIDEQSELETWQQLYLDKISEYGDLGDVGHFSLVYIAGDDIPELVVDTGVGGVRVYTASKGVLDSISVYSGNTLYIERENILYSYGGRMDNYRNRVYTIRDGVFTVLHEGSWKREVRLFDENAQSRDESRNYYYDGEYIFEEFLYFYWNGEEVTEIEYYRYIEMAFDMTRAVKVCEVTYTFIEIIEKISNSSGEVEGGEEGDVENSTVIHQFSGDVFDYIVYEEWRTERGFYFTIVVLKDGEIFQILHREGEDDASRAVMSELIFEADATFDGSNDILLSLGSFGAQGAVRYACFLYVDGGFVENPSFSEIANPVVDSENQVILSSWRNHAASYGYAMYRFINGEFVKTNRLTIGMVSENIYDESVLSWIDEIFVDGEWQIREKFTQNDFDDNGEWYEIMFNENDFWDLSGSREFWAGFYIPRAEVTS
jgi:hypothetical protein